MVCEFCEEHLEANRAAFKDPRLTLLYDDARAQLEASEGAALGLLELRGSYKDLVTYVTDLQAALT